MLKKFTDSKLQKLLEDRRELNTTLIEKDKEREKIETEMNKIALRMQKIKDKTIPIMKAHEEEWKKEGIFTEFDSITVVRISKNGDLEAEIVDQVEEYKNTLRAKYAKDNNDSKEKTGGNTSTGGVQKKA